MKEANQRKVGRPATGRTTDIIRASIPIWLVKEAKAAAFRNGETFSGLVARAVHSAILNQQSKP